MSVHRSWQLWAWVELMKRLLDCVAALFLLCALSPFILLLVLIVACKLGRPVLFRQLRPGKGGKPFMMLKFRTMSDARDLQGNLLTDAQRLTRFGMWLRRSSLDELPELINVLKGDMSLVGPRPLLMKYLGLYSMEQARRHEVRPGITGWAQVNGRNNLSWEEKFKLDVWYVDNRTIWLDLRILLMTLRKVIRSEGVSQPGHVTAAEFKGNQE